MNKYITHDLIKDRIKQNSYTSILAPAGCGKSTMIKAIMKDRIATKQKSLLIYPFSSYRTDYELTLGDYTKHVFQSSGELLIHSYLSNFVTSVEQYVNPNHKNKFSSVDDYIATVADVIADRFADYETYLDESDFLTGTQAWATDVGVNKIWFFNHRNEQVVVPYTQFARAIIKGLTRVGTVIGLSATKIPGERAVALMNIKSRVNIVSADFYDSGSVSDNRLMKYKQATIQSIIDKGGRVLNYVTRASIKKWMINDQSVTIARKANLPEVRVEDNNGLRLPAGYNLDTLYILPENNGKHGRTNAECVLRDEMFEQSKWINIMGSSAIGTNILDEAPVHIILQVDAIEIEGKEFHRLTATHIQAIWRPRNAPVHLHIIGRGVNYVQFVEESLRFTPFLDRELTNAKVNHHTVSGEGLYIGDAVGDAVGESVGESVGETPITDKKLAKQELDTAITLALASGLSQKEIQEEFAVKQPYLSKLKNAETKFEYTIFNDLDSTTGKLKQTDWKSFVDMNRDIKVFREKAEQPLVKLGRFNSNSRASGSELVMISGIEIDYDAGDVSVEQVAETLKTAGIKSLVVSTHSSTDANHKWRVFIPLSKKYTSSYRHSFVEHVDNLIGNIAAQESYATKQIFYVGRSVANEYKCVETEGEYLDVVFPESIQVHTFVEVKAQKQSSSFSTSLIDNFNSENNIETILMNNGYMKSGNRFISPTSSSGVAGIIVKNNKVYCHNQTDQLANRHWNDAFDVYRICEYNGDFTAAFDSIRPRFVKEQEFTIEIDMDQQVAFIETTIEPSTIVDMVMVQPDTTLSMASDDTTSDETTPRSTRSVPAFNTDYLIDAPVVKKSAVEFDISALFNSSPEVSSEEVVSEPEVEYVPRQIRTPSFDYAVPDRLLNMIAHF